MTISSRRSIAISTIDLEDYRRQYLRDYVGTEASPHPREVQRQLEMALGLLDECRVTATFFTVGRLARELTASSWAEIASRHRIGCHSQEHLSIRRLGPERFRLDLLAAKAALEDVAGQPVRSYRAPYFSAEGCDPWFGEVLAAAGITLDSSLRLNRVPLGFSGKYILPGSEGAVWEVPLPSIGWGSKRLTVIGGTYFRILPLRAILVLLAHCAGRGFIPLIYLHPYDLDSTAEPLPYPAWSLKSLIPRAADRIRRCGRETTAEKFRDLAKLYDFHPIEDFEDLLTHGAGDRLSSRIGHMTGVTGA